MVNATSRVGDEVYGYSHLLDTLVTLGVEVKKIFVPEHGFRIDVEAGGHIDDEVDPKTGIPIVSMYGATRRMKTDDIQDIDILVFDIQDVGVRFYTYINTLQYVMEAAAARGILLIVLDRPNPNGHYVDGPVLDTAYRTFVGLQPVPVVYGLTIGEYAQMLNGEHWIPKPCDLIVIPCQHYSHRTKYELPLPPSPNLPNLRSVLLYPGLCFFEGTVMSLGRGTSKPFQVVGHPDYPEHGFSFTPRSLRSAVNPPLKDQLCYGIDLSGADVDSLFKQGKMDLHLLLRCYQLMNRDTFFQAKWFDTLAGGPAFREAIEKGWTEAQIRESWKAGIVAFKEKRKKYLLYSE